MLKVLNLIFFSFQAMREPTLRKTSLPVALRPQSMLQQSSLQKQQSIFPLQKEVEISFPPTMNPPRLSGAASLDSTLADILSSPASSRFRNQRSRNKVVEVVHHLPRTMNSASRLKTSSPAVVYISKPQNNMQVPQGTFRDVLKTQMLPSSQTKLTQNFPFTLGEHDSLFTKDRHLNQGMSALRNAQNSRFVASNSKPFPQMQTSYEFPTTNWNGKFVKEDIQNHRFRKIPQSLRGVPSNVQVQQKPSSFARPVTPTRNNAPRITRLKQELNAELQEIRKLVPHPSMTATKKPKAVFQQQLPHPFLIPSPQYEATSDTNKQIKSTLNPESHKSRPNIEFSAAMDNKPVIRQPHFPLPENMKDLFLKVQASNRLPLSPVPNSSVLDERRPIVSESSVDSEELSEILKSMGYDDDKLIHESAGLKPVKLIIPNSSEHFEKQSNIPSQYEADDSPAHSEEPLVSQSGNLESSKNADMQFSRGQNLASFNIGYASPQGPHASQSSAEDGDLSPSQSEHLLPFDGADSPALQTDSQKMSNINDVTLLHDDNQKNEDSSSHQIYEEASPGDLLPFPSNEHSEIPNENKNIEHTHHEESSPKRGSVTSSASSDDSISDINSPKNTAPIETNTYSPPLSIQKNESSSNSEVLPRNRSTSMKTYFDFRKLNGRLQPASSQTSPKKVLEKEKTPVFSHDANTYQGEESIASISVKEDVPPDEEIKYHSKDEKPSVDNGTPHDVYNKKILDERIYDVPSSHSVRYFPQHYVPDDTRVVSTPNHENVGLSPEGTTETYETIQLSNSPELTEMSHTKVPNYVRPKERVRNIFPAFNTRERLPAMRATTIIPFYRETNRNININPLPMTTPRYIITKSPSRLPFGQRNRPRNENSLVRKYVMPGRQQFPNEETVYYLNHHTDYVTPPTFIRHRTSPRPPNMRFKPPPTERAQVLSNWNPRNLSTFNFGIATESYPNDYRTSHGILTTELPPGVTRSFDIITSESQVENTQEGENSENKYQNLHIPEAITTPNRQFFRGPQHTIIFDHMTTSSYLGPTATFNPNQLFETTIPPITTAVAETSGFMPYNETGGVRQYSVHPQTKVINAIHLANKIFGRRNHTLFRQFFSTTKTPKHKFTYAPVIKSSTAYPVSQSEIANGGSKVVFNFKTGTTQSMPSKPNSVKPKVEYISRNRSQLSSEMKNDSIEFVPALKEKDRIFISPKNSSKTSLFHHVVFSQANISSKSADKEISVTETNKDLYGILKPITKPYNSTSSVGENDAQKPTTKPFKSQTSSTTIESSSPTSTYSTKEVKRIELASTSAPKISQTSTQKIPLYIPPVTSGTSQKNVAKQVSETTESNTSMTEVQTEAPSKNELVANVTVSSEIVTELIDHEQLVVESLKSMKLKMQEMASKGLRHLMPLVMELSSDVTISSDCTFSLLRWLRAVRTMEQWAVRSKYIFVILFVYLILIIEISFCL